MSCESKRYQSIQAPSIKDYRRNDPLVISGRLPQNWIHFPHFFAWPARFSAAGSGGQLFIQAGAKPALTGLGEGLFVPVAELAHHLCPLAAALEQAHRLQQLPLGAQGIGREARIRDPALGEAGLPGGVTACLLADQCAPGALQQLICVLRQGAGLQLVEHHLQAMTIGPLPVTGALPLGQVVEQGIQQRGRLQPACLGWLGNPQGAGQQIMVAARQRTEGGEGIGAEPEAVACRQQQFMLAESQQCRAPGYPQQLTHRRAFAAADLQVRRGKMLAFDGVMHVKTLI